MDWAVFTHGPALPQFGAILGMLVLSVVVFRLGFLTPAHRAFALLLVLRGMSMLAATVSGLHTSGSAFPDREEARFWSNLFPWFVIPIPFAIVRFVSVYPRRRGFFGRHRAAVPVLVAGAVIGELIYLIDHAFWLRPFVTESGVLLWQHTGPLAVFLPLMYLGFGVLSLVFALDFVSMQPGPRRTALLLVTAAFAANSIYDSVGVIVYLLGNNVSFTATPLLVITSFALVPALGAAYLLVRHAMGAVDARHRANTWKAFALLPVAAVTAAVPIAVATTAGMPEAIRAAFTSTPYLLFLGLWRLLLPALVTYALIKFQLFDIDLKIKRTLKGSLLGAVGFGAFSLVSELLENQITPSLPDLAGLAIAVALAFTLSPLQKAAARVTDKVMPNTHETPEYLDRKRLDVYRATLEGAYEDGAITDRERRLLANLRVQLGLDPDVASALERDIRGGYGGAPSASPA